MEPGDDDPTPGTTLAGARWPVLVAAALGALVALIQLRHGVLQILDTGSYVSGVQAIRDGHPYTSTIAPSFSNFDVIEFLDRGGRLPFVDFPVGYITLAGPFSFVLGARRALAFVTVLATAAGRGGRRRAWRPEA
ncbi:MAG: hypothetical protein R2715_02660 [Ilumatobacteraceae bacterium]